MTAAAALGAAVSAAAARLHGVAQIGADLTGEPRLRAVGAQLQRLAADPALQSRLTAALDRAASTLSTEHPDPAALAAVFTALAAADPAVQQVCRMAAEELLLAARPNLGRLLDAYRRAPRADLPPWTSLAALLQRWLGDLLPPELAADPALAAALPPYADRELLDTARAAVGVSGGAPAASADALLAELSRPAQQIIASEGSSIDHVYQYYIQGDLIGTTQLAPADLTALYRRYCAFLIETFGTLDFRGVMQVQHVARLSLEEVYVPLAAELDLRLTIYDLRVGQGPRRSSDLLHTHDLIRDMPALVLLGHPGAGKSTLVRYILLSLARSEARTRFGLEGAWLPVFFPVATFAEARARQRDLAPLDYLQSYYLGLSQPDYAPLFRQALEHGRALVLLDGLDEVRDDRAGVARALDAFAREWDGPGNRLIATSRIAGYDDAPLDPALFAVATIKPLGDHDIRVFIGQWCQSYARAGEGAASGEALAEQRRRAADRGFELGQAVFGTPGVTDLARNPLLLTILALIHTQGATIPDRRADLYRLCIEALAETWNRARSLSGREIDVYLSGEKLSERFVVNLLGPAALWMHSEQPGGVVEQRDLERLLTATLMRADGLAHGAAQRLARSFIELMRRDTGLLHERGYRKFSFLHKTFEEYLAARALLESAAIEDTDRKFVSYAADPRWREVVRLAIAAAPQREAQRLLLLLTEAEPESDAARGRPALIAGEALLDIGRSGVTQRAASATIAALERTMADDRVPAATRKQVGEALYRLVRDEG